MKVFIVGFDRDFLIGHLMKIKNVYNKPVVFKSDLCGEIHVF